MSKSCCAAVFCVQCAVKVGISLPLYRERGAEFLRSRVYQSRHSNNWERYPEMMQCINRKKNK